MLRIFLAPLAGDAVSIHQDPEELVVFTREVVVQARGKIDAAFQLRLLNVIEDDLSYKQHYAIRDAEFDVCPPFRNCRSSQAKLENLDRFMKGEELPRNAAGAVLSLRDPAMRHADDQCRVLAAVLHSILVDVSLLQHNLICLDRLLEFAASTKVPLFSRNSVSFTSDPFRHFTRSSCLPSLPLPLTMLGHPDEYTATAVNECRDG